MALLLDRLKSQSKIGQVNHGSVESHHVGLIRRSARYNGTSWHSFFGRCYEVLTRDRAQDGSATIIRTLIACEMLVDWLEHSDRYSWIRVEVIDQIGVESSARDFFSVFRFKLNEPSLIDLEDALRRRFDRLGGTEIGWLNLKNELRFWVSHRYEPLPDGLIKLSESAAGARGEPVGGRTIIVITLVGATGS